MRRVLHHILIIRKFDQLPAAMCYDCACTLKLFIRRHFGTDELKSTDFTQFLTSLHMAIDRLHVSNHKRAMCKTIMRPDHSCHNGVYESIDTEVAEQLFAYLSKFKTFIPSIQLSQINHILHSSFPFEELCNYWYQLFQAKRAIRCYSQGFCLRQLFIVGFVIFLLRFCFW